MGVRRILVVDDQPDVVDSLAVLLRLSGHEVHTAFDGPSALASALEVLPEFIFLDIGLPGLDGFSVADQLRKAPSLRGARIIAVTAYGDEESRRRSREAGFDLYLVKPVAPRFVEDLVEGREGQLVAAG